MSSRILSVPETLEWKKAYTAAVLEKDRLRLPGLVDDAIQKLRLRLRDLCRTGPVPTDEIEAIHDAMYLLEALLSSLAYRDVNRE